VRSTLIERISVVAELERLKWDFRLQQDDQIKCRCPFHDDSHASCSIGAQSRKFKCHAAGCSAEGDFVSFVARALATDRKTVLFDLQSRYGVSRRRTISSQHIEKCHAALWTAGPLLEELRKRGVTDEAIRKRRIGYKDGRVTIPVYDESGACVNVRRYSPGAPPQDKMRNTPGCGAIRLYPLDQLEYDRVVLCGGEIKAVAIADAINRLGWGAVSTTGGEGSWSRGFNDLIRGKSVWVMMDVDDAGRTASERLCRLVKGAAKTVHDVLLPLDRGLYPTGDVNDWIGGEGATGEDIVKLLSATSEWEPAGRAENDDAPPVRVPFSAVTKAEHAGRRVVTTATVAALDVTPYTVPLTVRCECDRSQEGCGSCPVYPMQADGDGGTAVTIGPRSPALLEMVNASVKAMPEAIKKAAGIPRCKSASLTVLDYRNMEDCRLGPRLEVTERTTERTAVPAVFVGHGLESNAAYEVEGVMLPHPRDQHAVLLLSRASPIEDSLSTYRPTDDEMRELRAFQPGRWTTESIRERLDALYADLSANVTRIYGRPDMHMAVDLAYHSPLVLRFDGKRVKGWVEVLIIGDSSQGKTDVTAQMLDHYGLGAVVDCKNASVAGLVGGLQQIGTRWFVTWGALPAHDSGLVVLEELKGASTEVISRMTDMRSSGVARIEKIEKRRAHARTRIVAVSNPRDDAAMASFTFGVEAVKHLVGGLEDVRRFDLAMAVTADEIDPAELNRLRKHRPEVRHDATAVLSNRLVLWAWSRTEDQVSFDDDATEEALRVAGELCGDFDESIPLLDSGSTRYKVARLAAAAACRTFSHGDGWSARVRRCHVEFVGETLRRLYSSPGMGFDEYSRGRKRRAALLEPETIRTAVLQTPYPRDFIQQMLTTVDIELRDINDWCGWEKDDSLQLVSTLVRKHALTRVRNSYRKTPLFTRLLKELETSDALKGVDRPGHVERF